MDTASNYTVSIHYDRRLYRQDIAGSMAHARMLARQGIITDEARDAILAGLEEVRTEIEDGSFPWREELEDIHMNIERRLHEKIGAAAGRLHTARSRNDQVATDMRALREGRHWRGAGRDTRPPADACGQGQGQRFGCDSGVYAPAARSARLLRPPHAGLLRDAGAGRGALPAGAAAGRRDASGQWSARRRALPHRPRVCSRRAGLWVGKRQQHGRRLRPRLPARLPLGRCRVRGPHVAHGRRAGHMVFGGVRVRAAVGRVHDRQQHDAPEAGTPTLRSWRGARPDASSATWCRCLRS